MLCGVEPAPALSYDKEAKACVFLISSQCSIQPETVLPVLYILSACKAEEGSGVGPPLTDDNAADGKIGSAGSTVSGWMEH